MRIALILLAMLAVASSSLFLTAQESTTKKVEPKTTVPPGWQDGPVPVQPPSSVAGRRMLTLRDARRQGVTMLSLHAQRKALIASGDIEPTMSSAEEAVVMFERFSDSNPKALEKAGDIDAWLALFELLIDLIKRFFPS